MVTSAAGQSATAVYRGPLGCTLADGDPADRPHPELPAEMFYLSGFEGQNVVVVPSRELVVVRMGLTRSAARPIWTLTRGILDALE